MIGIKFLGTHGSVGINSHTTCIQLTDNTLIDAGSIMSSLGEKAKYINNIFLTHSHLDHIMGCSFLLDNFYMKREKPLIIYGLPETLQAVKENIFNHSIWPDFSKFNLKNSSTASLEFVEIEVGKRYKIENDIFLTPIEANHTIPCCGYIIEKNSNAILFSGDTYKNKKLWDYINTHSNVKTLIIDVSFPDNLSLIAQKSKHFYPKALKEDLVNLHRNNFNIYINHIKPSYEDEVIEDLSHIGITKQQVLNDGEIILYESGKKIENHQDLEDKIFRLNNIGASISAKENIDDFLKTIITEAKNITGADGGTIYLVDEDKLKFKIVQTDSLGINEVINNADTKWPSIPLYAEDKKLNKEMVAALCATTGEIFNIADVYKTDKFFFEGTKKFDSLNGYRSKSMLVLPLKNHENKIIGVLQLINKTNFLNDKVIEFDKNDEDTILSLASQAAISITNTQLITGLENLLEAFLKSVIYAIGEKSPHTAGHIDRMTQLSMMVSKAINKDKTTYKQKNFNKDELKQINIAALVHDIGKLTTPEHIINKSTKLEKIYDRLELILLKIKLIQNEFKILLLENKIDKEQYNDEIEKLENYAIFIEKSNNGSEWFSDKDAQKIEKIKKVTYIFGEKKYNILSDDEAYSLSIQKGTITKKERELINNHAIVSVDILNRLPFPEKYKEVPQIAGNHHEKINGKGYPKGLKGDEISFEARILAITDIFEALTASDRPYKEANSLSISMKILHAMAKDNSLDKGLVKFFYESGLYLEYAKKFLSKESIDKVDIDFSDLG